jgi:predicted phage terminase large subunit-like protein
MKAPSSTDRAEWAAHELAFGSCVDWVPRLFKGFTAPRHLAPIAALLDDATRDGNVRATCSAAPRHGKSCLLLTAAVRHLALHPGSSVIWASHSQELADLRSREARDAAVRAGLRIRRDAARLSRWELVGGGAFIAAGVGSSHITGMGADLLIADDLYGSRADAESGLCRDHVDHWWSGTFGTRATVEGSIILSGTRWHPDDQHARLAARGGWQNVNLRAVDDQGAALWPAAWPADKLDERRRELGDHDWHSLFLGEPRARGSAVFEGPGGRYTRAELVEVLRGGGARLVVACDPAASAKTHADHSAIVVAAIVGTGLARRMFILDVKRIRVEVPELLNILRTVAHDWGGAPVGVEAVAGFRAVPDMLKRIAPDLRVIPIQPRGDKFQRAQVLASAWKEGRVLLPADARPWMPAFCSEFSLFSGLGDAADDQVDATVHAWGMGATVGQADALAKRRAQWAALAPFG